MTEVRLPETSWLRSESLTQLVEALITDGVPPRLVGGAVRDALLGLPVSDVDLATPLTPNDVIARLEAHNIRAVPTGIAHGTVTAVIKGQNFEVTTLRRDVSTDGRRATVAFSTEWQQDAARRDFTINALYADPLTGEIFDYHQGLDDLATRTVRFIGDPMQRIAEDHLRILRFFRFYARFGSDSPDDAAIAACRAAVHSLKSLSRERITDELLKLLSLSTPLASITLMIENGVFGAFLPELTDSAATDLRRLIDREQQAFESPSALRRLAALIPIQAEQADKIAARLKLSTRQRKYLKSFDHSYRGHSLQRPGHCLSLRHGKCAGHRVAARR